MKYDPIVDEFIKAYPQTEENKKYIVFSPPEDTEYRILLFRTINEVHCYYSGHGNLSVKKSLDFFETPKEVLDWALSQREEMEIVELSPIDKIFMGLEYEEDEEEFNED